MESWEHHGRRPSESEDPTPPHTPIHGQERQQPAHWQELEGWHELHGRVQHWRERRREVEGRLQHGNERRRQRRIQHWRELDGKQHWRERRLPPWHERGQQQWHCSWEVLGRWVPWLLRATGPGDWRQRREDGWG